jgi:hypothetical protein
LPHLGYANGAKVVEMGSDIFTNPDGGTAPGGSSPPSCTSTPRVSQIKSDQDAKHLYLSGRAAEVPACSSTHLTSVSVAVALRTGKQCRFLGAKGKLSAARSCRRRTMIRATGTGSWRLVLRFSRRRGHYLVVTQAVGNGGVHGPLRDLSFSER